MRLNRFLVLFVSAMAMLGCAKRETVSITIDPPEVTLNPGGSLRLFALIKPEGSGASVSWSVLDQSVATVDEYGTVTAVSLGETVVSASALDATAACRVKVVPVSLTSITLNYHSYSAAPDDLVQLRVSVEPEEANVSFEWESSDPSVVTVDKNGLVTAVSYGKATVMVTAGGMSDECEFTVEDPAGMYDIFYADGTFSKTLDPSKEMRGFVFWKGNPTEFDPALKEDHPECCHGLAVAFREIYAPGTGSYTFYWIDYYADKGLVYYGNAGGRPWQEVPASVADWAAINCPGLNPVSAASLGTEETNIYLNNIQGYNNTKAIKAYNKEHSGSVVIPVSLIDEYEKAYPLPGNTSGYYLPSAKECSLLWGGEYNDNIFGSGSGDSVLKGINSLVRDINESGYVDESTMAYPLGESYYWTSTEDDSSSMAYYISGMVMGSTKASEYLVRYIFAF